MPGQESSQVRSAQRARSYEGIEQSAKPSAARRAGRVGQAWLLDQLVRTQEQRLWDGKTERLGGLHVDDELEFRRLLYRHFGWLSAIEDHANLFRRATEGVYEVWAVRQQPT